MPGVGGFYQVLCCDFFLAISTPGAGAGGLYIETGGAQTRTRTKRRTVVSSRVTWRGGSRWLFGDVPTRASAAVHTVYFQLDHCLCGDQAACARLAASAASAVVVRGGGLTGGHDFSHVRRRSITGAVRPVAHTGSTAALPWRLFSVRLRLPTTTMLPR